MAVNSGSLAELLVGRAWSGIGSVLGKTIGPIYILDDAPTEMRGMMTTFYIQSKLRKVGHPWANPLSL